ncbi:hypothetical protein ACFWX9_31925, partial [Streptomyces parvus]
LSRTSFGKSMYAVGGNMEAARRAGVDVKAVLTLGSALICTLGSALICWRRLTNLQPQSRLSKVALKPWS